MRTKVLLLLLVLAGIGGVLLFAGRLALYSVTPKNTGSKDTVIVEVRRGESNSEIARALEVAGVITRKNDFMLLGRLSRQWKHLKAGEYEFSPAMTPWEVFRRLGTGISVNHPLTIREGENSYEIAADLESKKLGTAAAFLKAVHDPQLMEGLGITMPPGKYASLEGYLFPETYFFNRTMTVDDMVREMVRKFLAEWTPESDVLAKSLGLSRHQLVILASVVEKETGHPQERPLIASVFYNRLKKHMPLQSDPTTIYGMWERYDGNLHKTDLKDPSPFNTYFIPALPIGPISNPGREAIQATLHPASSEFLYFVSHNDGTTEFSATLEAHNRAVQKFQVDPKGRQGKSWRDLSRTLQTNRAH